MNTVQEASHQVLLDVCTREAKEERHAVEEQGQTHIEKLDTRSVTGSRCLMGT